jgi:uncharacterized membrane protein YfcA
LNLEILGLLLLLGLFAGITAGLLGLGGGVIIVPVLVWLFHTTIPVPADSLMHIAVGTSLATIVVTSASSIISHHRRGAVLWSAAQKLAPGLVVGTLVGSILAAALPSDTLKIIFGLFLLVVAAQMSFGAQPSPHRQLPNRREALFAGSGIGVLSALVGIGGGSLTVPFLTWCNVSIRNAVATSAACGFPIALSGTLGFIFTGWHLNDTLNWNSGYIYWPAFIAIVPTSLLFAPVGAKLAHSIPLTALKKIFALFLVIVALEMLLNVSST